jgi:hypothetical protein
MGKKCRDRKQVGSKARASNKEESVEEDTQDDDAVENYAAATCRYSFAWTTTSGVLQSYIHEKTISLHQVKHIGCILCVLFIAYNWGVLQGHQSAARLHSFERL